MTTPLPIDKVLTDPRLLGGELGDISTWATWLVVLKAAFGHRLTDEELQVFKAVAGGRSLPLKRVRELWVCAGRRSGKSRMAAALAVYFGLFVKHKLSAGEKGMVLVISPTVDTSKVVFNYVLGFLRKSPVLRNEIDSTTRNEIRLKSGIVISIQACGFRNLRGRTVVFCVLEEISFFRDDTTATPDTEVYTAVLPALLTTNGMCCAISSPYRKTGIMHAKHKLFFGTDSDDTLVVQAPTLVFNKTLDPAAIAAQREADPIAARSEWDAEFRADLVGFLDEELIEAAVDRGRPLELPPRPELYYRAYVDASGGAIGGDAYAIAIAHRENGRYVVDAVRGRSGPFEPNELTKEYAALCKEYRVGSVTGDKYGMEWVQSVWRNVGVSYVKSELTASELYLESLPLFTRSLVALPDHPVLLRELRLLERSPARLKREQISHPRGVHDDYANVCCGVLCGLATYLGASAYADALWRAGDDDVPSAELDWHEQQRQRRHDELLARYGQPVVLHPPPRELLSEAQREAYDRARADAARQRART